MVYHRGMFLTNHALTGAAIGLALPAPEAVVPLAFASHFALDALPHFGMAHWSNFQGFQDPRWRAVGTADSVLATGVAVGLCLIFPGRALPIALGAFCAMLPDLFYVPEIFFKVRLDKALRRFHHWVQWGERPWGWIIELAWAAGMAWVIRRLG